MECSLRPADIQHFPVSPQKTNNMFNEFVLGKSPWRNISFDALIVSVTMGGICVLRIDNITWINLESFALMFNAAAIASLHHKDFQSRNYLFFTASSLIGIAVTVLPLLPYPEELKWLVDVLHGDVEDGVRILNGNNPPQPSTFISFVGMITFYSSVVGGIKLSYLEVLNALIGNGSQKAT